MVHSAAIGAAASASASNSSSFRPRMLSRSSGSFHAGDIFPSFARRDSVPSTSANVGARRPATADSAAAPPPLSAATTMRRSSSVKYHTFPTPDSSQTTETPHLFISSRQKRRRRIQRQLQGESSSDDDGHSHSQREARHRARQDATPLPVRQLGLLALLSLAEQTALNSISPYLPTMVESFAEIPDGEMGLYVGLLASTFALAQLTTNLFWGYLSDAIGRKPVMLMGSFLLMLCFCLFGFCTKYWHVVVIHIAMGLLNGNAAVVPTCLGEVTDRTNQSSAFTWLPVMYSVGSITGPALGGLLVGPPFGTAKYPFLAPNIGSALLLGAAAVVLGAFFDETLDSCDRRTLPPSLMWIDDMWKWCCCCLPRLGSGSSSVSSTPSVSPESSPDGTPSETSPLIAAEDSTHEHASAHPDDGHSEDDTTKIPKKTIVQQLLNHKTILLLSTYLVFQLSNISFNSLYPIFSSAPPPTGRDMPPGQIGLLLSFAGFATILFQVTVFQPLKSKMGNLGTYRGALFGLALSMMFMPWVSHADDSPPFGLGDDSTWWLYGEIAFVLVIKNICAVGGLSSVMLLINNSAPSPETLGTLNGIAQTLSAAGRSIGPFMSGALFSLSTNIPGKGELLAWWIFGGVAGMGWLLSLVLNGRGLESADWEGDLSEDEDEDEDEEEHDESDETDATA
ncbi:major facilitator superfamily transporter [Ophiostoma piceae UAMH 11346]|uniref:Major facilitator superfamily transporter n=1 Tax=Ophiostoma piceae (strain UAMH 11346) TaxID=1262450 RepID=S3C5I6_OPHP1|nr:major facilitator superfamily transporter [Ophiostoma piceae UAMH 11346]